MKYRKTILAVTLLLLATAATAQLQFKTENPIDYFSSIDMNNNQVANLSDPVNSGDAVPLDYIQGRFLERDGDTMNGNLNMNGNNLSNVDSINGKNVSSLGSDGYIGNTGTHTAGGNLNMNGNRIKKAFIPQANTISGNFIGQMDNAFYRADQRWTCSGDCSAEMFDGRMATSTRWDSNSTPIQFRIMFSNTQHYWGAFRIHFNWGRWTDSFTIERRDDSDQDGSCSDESGWTTLKNKSSFSGYEYKTANTGGSWACGFRFTFQRENANLNYDDDFRIAEVMAYRYYQGHNGMYLSRNGDSMYGNLDMNGNSVKNADLESGSVDEGEISQNTLDDSEIQDNVIDNSELQQNDNYKIDTNTGPPNNPMLMLSNPADEGDASGLVVETDGDGLSSNDVLMDLRADTSGGDTNKDDSEFIVGSGGSVAINKDYDAGQSIPHTLEVGGSVSAEGDLDMNGNSVKNVNVNRKGCRAGSPGSRISVSSNPGTLCSVSFPDTAGQMIMVQGSACNYDTGGGDDYGEIFINVDGTEKTPVRGIADGDSDNNWYFCSNTFTVYVGDGGNSDTIALRKTCTSSDCKTWTGTLTVIGM